MSATSKNFSKPLKVLGIDPGSRFLGYGLVNKQGNRLTALTYGTLKLNAKHEMSQRLHTIHQEVFEILKIHQPDCVAIEKVFFAKDASAALKLGQARGVVLLAIAQAGIPLFEYSPNEVKVAVAGYGHADKDQMARMVTLLLGVQNFQTADTSDALAIAICHLNSYIYHEKLKAKAPSL